MKWHHSELLCFRTSQHCGAQGRGLGRAPRAPTALPRAATATPRGHCPHKGCSRQATVTPASVSPPVLHVRGSRAVPGPAEVEALVPTPTPGRGKAPAWQAARFSEEKTSSGGNPAEIPAAMAGTWKTGTGRDSTTPAAPKSLPASPPKSQRGPQTYIQVPSVAQSIPPGRERVPHVQRQRGPRRQRPGQAEHPGQPHGPLALGTPTTGRGPRGQRAGAAPGTPSRAPRAGRGAVKN